MSWGVMVGFFVDGVIATFDEDGRGESGDVCGREVSRCDQVLGARMARRVLQVSCWECVAKSVSADLARGCSSLEAPRSCRLGRFEAGNGPVARMALRGG